MKLRVGAIPSGWVACYAGAMVVIRVRAFWDDEAGVWVAESADVPGLVTEAPGLDSLKAKLDALIPELLAANGMATQPSVPVELLAEFREPLPASRA